MTSGCWHLNSTHMPTLINPSTLITVRPSGAAVTIRPSSPVQVSPRPLFEISRVHVESITVRPGSATPIGPARAETVRPPERGAWDERGWIRRRGGNNDVYEGEYQVGRRRFRGRIEVRRNRIQAYIYEPPREIRRHRHHACFQQHGTGTGWFILHWQRSPRNVDEALLYFEQILDESINNR